jgi:hypothetical protein
MDDEKFNALIEEEQERPPAKRRRLAPTLEIVKVTDEDPIEAPKDSNELLEFKERVLEQTLQIKPKPPKKKRKAYFIEVEEGEKKPSLFKQFNEVLSLSSISSPGDSSALSSPMPRRRTASKRSPKDEAEAAPSDEEADEFEEIIRPLKKRKRSSPKSDIKDSRETALQPIPMQSLETVAHSNPIAGSAEEPHDLTRNGVHANNNHRQEQQHPLGFERDIFGDDVNLNEPPNLNGEHDANLNEDPLEQLSGGFSLNDQVWYPEEQPQGELPADTNQAELPSPIKQRLVPDAFDSTHRAEEADFFQ